MNLALSCSAKPLHRKPQFGSIQENDPFQDLFPHRYDYIWAKHPGPGQRPSWQTESHHLLSDRLIRQGSYLYGVRFGSKTNYCLLDIDINSLYHPDRDPFAISRMVAALEPLGLVRYIACTSSYSNGIHLYFPFENAQDSYIIARVVQALLENAGFIFSPGHLELFPNDRGFVDGVPALYAAHRLPMQAGSYLLNSQFDIIWSDQNTFVQHWHLAQQHNQLDEKTLRQVLKTAKRKRYRISGKAEKFLNDLTTEVYQGWTDFGQTNRLLGRIAMFTYIFWHHLNGCEPLEGKQLVKQIVDLAKNLPGYTAFCRHQHEIEQRAEEWARCIESSCYFPYGSGKNKSKQLEKVEQTTSTWHKQKQEEARERIRKAIAHLLESNALPVKTTARFQSLVKQGIGGETLYKHKDLWHPEHFKPVEPSLTSLDLESDAQEVLKEATSLLPAQSSNPLCSKDLKEFEADTDNSISSNTQFEERDIERVRQQVAEIEARQAHKRTLERAAWEQHLLNQQSFTPPSPSYLAKLQQWLQSGDAILITEATNILKHLSKTKEVG